VTKRKTPLDEQFVKLTRGVLESDAWQGLGINARRFLDFLLLEHLKHGGQENGLLIAPRKQLRQRIASRHITSAIEETVQAGLVAVKRGVGKRPNRYTLAWLPHHDITLPTRRKS
jgi:hypothetical protein